MSSQTKIVDPDDCSWVDFTTSADGRVCIELLQTIGIEDGDSMCAIVNPQEVIDRIHELYPDVKPSPPKPKVGDRVRTPLEGMGEVRAIGVLVRLDEANEADPSHFYRYDMIELVERGES